MHGRSSLSEEQRETAVALFETGWGAWAVATRLGVGRGAIKRLYGRWRTRGGTTSVPAWAHYQSCVRLTGAIPVPVPLKPDADFGLDLDAIKAAITGCPHCAHIGRRTGSYWSRIGPDSGCFRDLPVFARVGMQFESHLGHVFSLFRGLWASECAQTVHMRARSGALFVGGRRCDRVPPCLLGRCVWYLLSLHCR
jgi:hypothetical protein